MPVPPCPPLLSFIIVADLVITTAFLLEMALRCVAQGFAWGPRAYLATGWNRMDFGIVLVSVVSLGLGGSSSLTALRSLRVRGGEPKVFPCARPRARARAAKGGGMDGTLGGWCVCWGGGGEGGAGN